ncbi:MAG: Gfo/Idh/MocA family oxidoreductase, partial [Candidatus Hydrogenedentes bacterium]|nr:Gfo/Idh/MocA family oxidoreductase [Candidatus Hydrogenedentota bacterium]
MKTTAGVAVATLPKTLFPSTVLGANERILTGHIGLGGMGKRDLQFVMLRDDMQPIVMCDLLEEHREQGADITEGKFNRPPTTAYFEEVIANKDVDAVVIATPDHWHALPVIMACEAGKDVYCEKPLATTIREGRAIVDAVHRNNTVFQLGTMQRSGPYFQEAVELIRNGHIGTIARVETWAHDARPIGGLGNPPDEIPPEGLDWDRYVGWTPKVPYNRNRFLHNFRWFLDYSGGKITDWGTHLIDIALWAMGEEKHPKSVTAMGGKYITQDNTTVPDTLEVLWEFDDYVLSFSDRMYNPMPEGRGMHYGILFHGTLGTMRVDRKGYEIFSFKHNGGCERKVVKNAKEMPMNTGHWENFADCVRSRELPICHVDIAHNTTSVCHMGTSAYVAGGRVHWDAEKQRFFGKDKPAVKKANAWAYRKYENGWSLESPYYDDWKV